MIVGEAGALVTRVLYRKNNEAKHFTIVDAAMNDLMRPALYNSYHPIQPVERPERAGHADRRRRADLRDRRFLRARPRACRRSMQGELLCIGAAGAYGCGDVVELQHAPARGGSPRRRGILHRDPGTRDLRAPARRRAPRVD